MAIHRTSLSFERINRYSSREFENLRQRAVEDCRFALDPKYAELSRDDWNRRTEAWSSKLAYGVMAHETAGYCGLAVGAVDVTDSEHVNLVTLWVTPERRRRAIGRQMVSAVKDWSLFLRRSALQVFVQNDDERASQFFKNLGFVPDPVRVLPADIPFQGRYELSLLAG